MRAGVVLAAMACGLVGCSGSPSADRPAASAAATPGAAAPSTGAARVTAADYETAVEQLKSCVTSGGVKLFNDGWDPVDHDQILLRFQGGDGMSEQRAGEVYDGCAVTHLDPVAAGYLRDNPSRMTPELMTAVQSCADGRELGLTGREKNPQDLLAAVPEGRQEQLRACVRESVSKVYPDLFSTSFP